MPPTQPPRAVRILLVEDNPGDAALTMEAMKDFKTPVEVTRVPDGEAALAYLSQEGAYSGVPLPDLIFLDLNMPKKSGIEVLSKIKGTPQWEKIPVLVLTSSRADTDIQKAYDSKANFYIVKPPDLFGLFDTMKYVEDVWLKGIQATLK
jgi:CheY-like chemotaxis protein